MRKGGKAFSLRAMIQNSDQETAESRDQVLPSPEQQARQHATVREAHETELIEDYVELIAELLDHEGEARAVDLARRMGVRHATVTRMVRRLVERGLVRAEPYRSIFLTDDGRALAERSRDRHAIVLRFLRALGVGDTVARVDAEGIEHHVSPETLEAMRRFIGSSKA